MINHIVDWLFSRDKNQQFWTSQNNFWNHVTKHCEEVKSFHWEGVKYDFSKSFTVLSEDVVKQFKSLQESFYSEVAKSAMDPKNFQFFSRPINSPLWSEVYYDHKTGSVCITSIGDQKIITAHRTSYNKFAKKFLKVKNSPNHKIDWESTMKRTKEIWN